MGTIWLLLAVLNASAWFFPAPIDKLGWVLRVRPLDIHRDYLAQEDMSLYSLAVVLINRSSEARQHIPLKLARNTGDLRGAFVGSDGTTLRSHLEGIGGKQSEERSQLAFGRFSSSTFAFQDFGYFQLPETGEYELRASLKTVEGVISAPAVKFKVIEPTADDILASQAVPLEGQFSKWPKEKQERAVVQQIRIGNKVWLFYRKFLSSELGGKVEFAIRIAELPGKVVDFKVDGAFGDHNPLTITYRETIYTKWTTTHVINSVDGRPWTAAEEKHRQEKLKREAKLPAEKK